MIAPMKTSDGRFGYEAAGDPGCRRWCSCTASAARRGPGAASWIISATAIAPSPGTCRAMAARRRLPTVSIATLADALQDFLQQVGATKPILVGHSIGGMIVQQLLAQQPRCRRRRGAGADQPGLRQARRRLAESIHRRPARPARSRRDMVSLAPIAGEGTGRRRSRYRGHGAGARLHGRAFPRRPIAPPCWR